MKPDYKKIAKKFLSEITSNNSNLLNEDDFAEACQMEDMMDEEDFQDMLDEDSMVNEMLNCDNWKGRPACEHFGGTVHHQLMNGKESCICKGAKLGPDRTVDPSADPSDPNWKDRRTEDLDEFVLDMSSFRDAGRGDIREQIKEQFSADTGTCDEMFSSDPSAQNYEPNCVKCLAAQGGSFSAFNANITGPNCECCEGDDVTPEPGDGDRCENCCCEPIDIGVGVCKPGTEVMPNINFPNPKCDCSLIGLIDAPAGNKNCKGGDSSRGEPTQGRAVSERLHELKRFKKLAGISKKK